MAPVPSGVFRFQGLLACYVTVREEVQSWSDFFKANNGRRPMVSSKNEHCMKCIQNTCCSRVQIRTISLYVCMEL